LAAAPCLAAPAVSTPLPADQAKRIDADVARALRRFGVPGGAVLVLQDGRVSYVGAFGLRDLARRLAVRPETYFEIGSITKQFTAASILQLQQAGKLQIDRPLADYLPDAPHAREVTLRQLLAQTSGLHDYLDLPADQTDRLVTQPIRYADLVARVASLPLDFKPGSRWSYSNTGYLLLGKVIEVVSGEPYRDYLQRHIFDPLHMTQTCTTAEEPRLPDMAKGYRHRIGALGRAPIIDPSWGGAAGFLVTTVGDLAKWDAALQGGKVVSPESYHQMMTAMETSQNVNADYGLGLFVGSMFGQPRIGHTGGSIGFTTADEYYPRQQTRIIAFTNLGDDAPEAGEALTNIVFADLHPEIVADSRRPAPGEDARISRVVLSAFGELQAGKAYAAFGDRLKAKLGAGEGARLASGLGAYRAPSAAIFRGARETDRQRWFDYLILFGPGVSLPFSVRMDEGFSVVGFSVG
jgi:CubicO group peptidase (beta-lactamase class C family)